MNRQEKDEWRKQEIRAAATRCFVRRGFAATRLVDIAKEAGLSKGGVYFHYRAKEALFQDILDARLAGIQKRWSFEPVVDEPADVTLYRLVLAHLRTVEDEPEETCLGHLLVSMASQDALVRQKLEDAYATIRELYAGVLARGLEDGTFAGSTAESLARGIVAMVHGFAAHAALHPEGHLPLPAEAIAQLALRMVGRPVVAERASEERRTFEDSPSYAP